MKALQKYRFTDETLSFNGKTLRRIQATRPIPGIGVEIGDLGGWLESDINLSQTGDCWVFDDAKVFECAEVYGYARVFGNAEVCDFAEVYEYAAIYDWAQVYEWARVCGETKVFGRAEVCHDAKICDNAKVLGDALIGGYAIIGQDAKVCRNDQFLVIDPIGSRNDYVTFYRATKAYRRVIRVSCGCFQGTIDEFATAVHATHRNNKHGASYECAIALAKAQINLR